MKIHAVILSLFLFLCASPVWAQSTYNGEFIFAQYDFRQFDILGSGPVTGGVSGNNLVITSSGGHYSYQGYQPSAYTLNWSVSFDKSTAASMVTGTGSSHYTGSFTYGTLDSAGSVSVLGSGQINGSASNGVLTLQTTDGRMGVGGVNPDNITFGDPNTIGFNWNASMPLTTFKQWLGM